MMRSFGLIVWTVHVNSLINTHLWENLHFSPMSALCVSAAYGVEVFERLAR